MKIINAGDGFEGLWFSNEGSGGSGDDEDDVIIDSQVNTLSVQTASSSHHNSPSDATTVASRVITYVTTVVTQSTDSGDFVNERLFIFIGVVLGLVAVAAGICLYIMYFRGRRKRHTITPTATKH